MELKLINETELDRCYSIAPLTYQNKQHILVAAEKVNKCILFDLDGNQEDVIWEEPGGTMSMVQVPGKDGWFLATHQFYSPNDGVNAKIVLVRPVDNKWQVQTVVELPYTHRFGLLKSEGKYYLLACSIKDKLEYKDDWRFPGKIFACEFPENIEDYNIDNQLPMRVLKEGLTKNHGYCSVNDEYALIGAEEGIFKVTPPQNGNDWQIEQLIDEPTSDMVLCDFDDDGLDEMITISPFHGENIYIYKLVNGKYEKVWTCPFLTEFGHSIWAIKYKGKNVTIIGHRKGERDIILFYYEDGEYKTDILVHDVGSANIFPYEKEGQQRLVSTNREISQIAFYDIK